MSSTSKEWKLNALLKAFRFLIWQKKLGMTPGTYSKKENGHIRINVDDLAKVIEVLELPQDKCGIFFTYRVSKMSTEQKQTS